MKVGINGMGRIGRLALRAAMGAAERQADDPRAGNRLEVAHLNEIKGGAAATAHLLAFDSVQGKWRADIRAEGEDTIRIDDRKLSFSSHATAADIPWGDLAWMWCSNAPASSSPLSPCRATSIAAPSA